MVYATEGLIETLLGRAEDADPTRTTVSIAVTPAGDIPEADLPGETPIFTHFYMPEAGGSVNFVFGVDLGTPVGQTQGRFVSHPDGTFAVTKEDDLHGVILVAVPPWDRDSIGAFDRRGEEQALVVLDVEPPEELLE